MEETKNNAGRTGKTDHGDKRSLNETPNANRVSIAFFGRRNAGKSSLLNAVTGQEAAIVSEVKGTTTDPVSKAMELLPLGPVLLTDTPGLDDSGAVGDLRVKKARQVLNKTDVALLVVDATVGMTDVEKDILTLIQAKEIPYLLIYNKCDLVPAGLTAETPAQEGQMRENSAQTDSKTLYVSAKTGENIHALKERIAAAAKREGEEKRLLFDLLSPKDIVVLVTPIDSSAPKGRMILPQVQTIRDILDSHGVCFVTQVEELADCLCALAHPPRLVVTDSQAFQKVASIVPEDVPLTSFSILFARLKGFLHTAAAGAQTLSSLREGDVLLISEGCTHHRQCEDIGTVKLPKWIEASTGKKFRYEFTSGGGFPEELSPEKYALIVHCGGCMLTEREMQYRMRCAVDAGVPFTNYGTLIAQMNGILTRSLRALGPAFEALAAPGAGQK